MLIDIIDKNIGLSATVEIEGSKLHKLQIESLISTPNNSGLPAYAPFNTQNSEKLPAQFVLKLPQPFPMLNTSINQIMNEINEPATIKEFFTNLMSSSKESLISLIARQELDLNRGPFGRSVDITKASDSDLCDIRKHVYTLKLLEQHHTYHILDQYLECQDGVYVTKIPFTHPTSIPNIIRVLRQQALFNFVVGSCIRRNKSTNSSNSDDQISKLSNEAIIFDVIPVSLSNICVSFEHPSKESLATIEIDFKELNCQLYALDKESVCSNEYATKVLQKCWSIPILLRSVLKKCDERRLALLEDANKRRELELQELLANSTAQQGLQYNSNIQIQETKLQSKFNSLNEKQSNQRDLNSIAEFLTSKINNANSIDVQTTDTNTTNSEASDSRNNLLKKFSCKPKAKQSTATKNQTGNKILSLMLKRQNSTPSSVDDASLKATLTKKPKTKISQGEIGNKLLSNNLPTTKLISSEAAIAARLASKQAKHSPNQQNASLSLIKASHKPQMTGNASIVLPGVAGSLTQGPQASTKLIESLNLNNSTNPNRSKLQANGSNSLTKPRKSSIGAVIDHLVGALNPSEQNSSSSASASNDSVETLSKSVDLSKSGSSGVKSKSRQADQFAIKQGSLGGLKLTVTKTKTASSASFSNPPQSTSSSTSSSATSSSSVSTNPITATSSSSNNNSNSNSANAFGINASTSSNSNSGSNPKSDTGSAPTLGTLTTSIKYTIPKISKTQQPSSNLSENQNQSSTDSNTQGDDSINSSSSTTLQTASSSTANNKRTTSFPFSRTTNSNRNPVSSSTHPLGRMTSNPLANAGRPSSTSMNDNHPMNRLYNSNQAQRQQMNNRLMNLHQQQQQQPQQQPVQRLLQSSVGVIPTQQHQQQLSQGSMFAIGLSQQPGPSQAQGDLNLVVANQAALLNQQRNQNANPVVQQQHLSMPFMSSSVDANLISSSRPHFAVTALPGAATTISAAVPSIPVSTGVSSSSDSASQDPGPTISTPSSPTECGQVETTDPPPMIPIDSLEEPQATSSENDHPDDASDRLSIVDTNENVADSNSIGGTPKPSNTGSPQPGQDSNSATPSSSSRIADSTPSVSSALDSSIQPDAPIAEDSIGSVMDK